MCKGGRKMIAKTNLDQNRRQYGFLTVDELIERVGKNNVIFDPYSLLISLNATIGVNNVFYPNIIVDVDSNSELTIGSNNHFSAGTHLEAKNGGKLVIGDSNFFSDGVICIKSNMRTADIQIMNDTRFEGIINVFGQCQFGAGSQVLGNISVYNCILHQGGSYKEPNVESRAGLIKGFGTARGLEVSRGMVINGWGVFDQKTMEPQLNYHKK